MMNDAAVAMMSEALCVVEREREGERKKKRKISLPRAVFSG